MVFEKSANLLRQELSLKESLISVYLSCAAENLKRISQGTTYSNYLNKQGSDFRSLAALMFPPEFDVFLFDFSPTFDRTIE